MSQGNPKKGSRNVAVGQVAAASFSTTGKSTAERPATSRMSARQSQGNQGYVTARAHHQAMPAEPMFGPKIAANGQSTNQNLYTIQYS